MNRPDIARLFLSILLALVPASLTVLHAQYSDAAFTQKKAGELYDERGFYQNKAITVDGKLVVSNSNGNVSYSYPISSWQEDGFSFSTALNYCGSVAFSTHGEYLPGNTDNPAIQWSRFSQNRPAWLLGVNGFAVQSLSLATSFHADPSWLTSYANMSNTTFDDADFVWTIDGYDICNRMQDFATGDYNEAGGGGGGSTRQVYRDVIRLLRDDGSVLELLNVNESSDNAGVSDNWGVSQHLYSGYYVVNEANHPGYARVEFTADQQLYPIYLYDNVEDAPRYAARKVHYYPGDGLEYIFLERFNPYGMPDLREALVRFGGAKANPTIFYLSEIRSPGRTLVGFTYSRQGVQYRNTGEVIWDMRNDSTLGRALLTDFNNHTITYNDGSIVISAFNRTTKLIFDQVSYSGNASSAERFPLASLGYYNSGSAALAKVSLNDGNQYKSWVGYLTKIIDPEKRETTFNYEQYERRKLDYGWPRSSGAQTIALELKNYRLSQIVEPSAKYTIKYHNRSGGIESLDVDGLDTLTVGFGDEGYYPFAFSNAARLVEKRTLEDDLLTTDRYDFLFTSLPSAPATTPYRCDVVTTDAVTGFVDSSIYSYDRQQLPRSIPFSPEKYYTKLTKVERIVKDETNTPIQSTSTLRYYTGAAPYLWLPNDEVTYINGAPKSRAHLYYLTDTVRYYGGNDTLIKYHGMELLRQISVTRDPLYSTHVIDTTLFTHIPELDTTFFHTDSVLDWATMRRRYDSLRNQVEDPLAKSVDFSRMLDDPRVYARKLDTIVDGQYTIPPIFGLPSESWTTDTAGTYLGGKKSIYCLLGDCDAGPATASWFNRLLLHGAKIADTTYGRGRSRAVAGTRPVYEKANRGLPDYTQNIVGSRALYDYGQPGNTGMAIGQGKLLANDGVIYDHSVLSTSYLSRAFGVPQMQGAVVRSYNPSGVLLADTLTTMQELTHYGLAAGVVDPNGWYSEFDYDYNGRLNTAWLAGDFQSPDSLYYVDVNDPVTLVGYGSSEWQTHKVEEHYNLSCVLTDSTWNVQVVDHFGGFVVNKPINIVPQCGGGYDTLAAAREKNDGAAIQTTAYDLQYTVTTPSVAGLTFRLQTPGVEELLSLDSAFVELTIASVTGECVTLDVTMPAYSTFQKTYVLNCEELDPGTGDDTLASNETIRIPLGNYLDSIAEDQTVTFRFATTTSGGEVRMVNWYESEDESRPRMVLYGLFRKFERGADYTLKYQHDDALLRSEIRAKVDDSAHSANRVFATSAMHGGARHTQIEHQFGAGYRLLKSRTSIGDPDSPARIDSISAEHTGLGAVLKATDQMGDTVSTVYDALGRPVKNYNQDGTFSTIAYYTCGYDPGYSLGDCPPICGDCFGLDPGDQDFYGFVSATVTTNENGIKFAQYYDAFDRLRREIADSGGLNRVTKYEYDMLGRTRMVVNPARDTILYWYDNLGRVRYKQQPDLGTISYAYDDLGNPRFIQTEEQEEELRVTFNQYDDLNRLVVVGEADFYNPEEPGGGGEESSIGMSDTTSSLHTMLQYGDENLALSLPTTALQRGDAEPTGNTPNAADQDPSLPTTALQRGDAGQLGTASRHAAAQHATPGDPEKSGHRILNVPTDDTLNLNRLTDQLDPNYLHDSGKSAILTANKTLWTQPILYGKTVPAFWNLALMDTVARNCATMNSLRPDAVGPFLRHPATVYEPTNTVSTVQDFENLAKYPENVRIAISYDKLPPTVGAVWGNFPLHSQWNALTPTGQVRNLKGHEAAVAYREHGGQPYHYSVMSYDERGRVEALIHYTENLGFDAVYYQYNAMNQVNRLTVVDPLRRYTTWYGYDHNGRVDSVWTRLENANSGLWKAGTGVWAYNSGSINHVNVPEIRYLYTKTGQLDTMWYPRINTKTAYNYNHRKWLDTLVATRGANDVFREYLTFDPTGQITKQMSKQGTGSWLRQDYFYDDLGQLTHWRKDSGTGYGELYNYDSVGNRVVLYNENNTGSITSWRNYDIGRRVSPGDGPNQMLKSTNRNFFLIADYTTYEYDSDGAQNRRKLYNSGGTLQLDEKFSYSSWRGLSWKYERTNPNLIGANTWEWRYRYNAMGSREQKREMLNPGSDGTASNGYNWTYYLFSGRQRLTIWEGLQTSDATFCSHPGTGSYVHFYPGEYITYGKSTTSIITKPTPTSSTQEYRIADHLGSNRVVLVSNGSILSTADYKPFGEMLSGSMDAYANFIDKERDIESQLGNFGVREYDYVAGQFTSIDPSWESFSFYSPYHYSKNNPVNFIDFNGQFPITFHTRTFAPWNTFARSGLTGYHGDGENRGFTIAASASYRTGSATTVETDNMSITQVTPYNPSKSTGYVNHLFGDPDTWSAMSESRVNATITGRELLVHTYGNNEAAPLSPDIDINQKVKLSVTEYENGSSSLNLYGQITGDNFPAVESFVEDGSGTRVFVGVDAVEGGMRDAGPYILLWGRGLMGRTYINMTIEVDSNGNFVKVSDYTGTYTVGQWNRRFEQRSTTY